MYCTHCGRQMDPAARFCSGCGAAVQDGSCARMYYPRRMVRPRYPRMIAGVCAGFAEHYDWDLSLVRILAALALFVSCGTVMLLYFIAWIVIPDAPYSLPEAGFGSTSHTAGSAGPAAGSTGQSV